MGYNPVESRVLARHTSFATFVWVGRADFWPDIHVFVQGYFERYAKCLVNVTSGIRIDRTSQYNIAYIRPAVVIPGKEI